jgi:hypothetical protein
MKYYFVFYILLSLNAYSQAVDSSYYNNNKIHLLTFVQPQFKVNQVDTANSNQTLLKYATQQGKGQYLAIQHKQILNPNAAFQMSLKRYNQEGLFINELLETSQFNISAYFQNNKKNYQMLANYGSQYYEADENGGIANFVDGTYEDYLLYPTLLDNASNLGKNKFFHIEQKLNITKDLSLLHKFSRKTLARTFEDQFPNSDYYTYTHFDTLQTIDSTYVREVHNQVGIEYNKLAIYYQHYTQFNFQSLKLDSNYIAHGIGLDYALRIQNLESKLHFSANTDFYSSQFLLANSASKIPWNLQIYSDKKNPSVFKNIYYSNHFIFDNDFTSTYKQGLDFGMRYQKLTITSKLDRHDDYIYLDQSRNYQQELEPFYVWINQLEYKWNWKYLYGSHFLKHQHVTNADVFRVPSFYVHSTIYLGNLFFNDVLNSRFGVDIDYFSEYYADAYLPALASTHLQDDLLIGNQAYLTAFLSFTIQSFQLRFQIKNVLNYISQETYYSLPSYPIHTSPFELSVLWNLQN